MIERLVVVAFGVAERRHALQNESPLSDLEAMKVAVVLLLMLLLSADALVIPVVLVCDDHGSAGKQVGA